MFRTDKTITIDAPIEAVFAYFVDPTRQPEYASGVAEVKDLERLPDGRSIYTLVSKILSLRVDVKCEQVEVIPNEGIVEQAWSTFADITTTERFERQADGTTRVSVVSENTIHGSGPLARFGEAFFAKYLEHGAEMALAAAKAHIEASIPARPAAAR